MHLLDFFSIYWLMWQILITKQIILIIINIEKFKIGDEVIITKQYDQNPGIGETEKLTRIDKESTYAPYRVFIYSLNREI